MVRCRDVGVGWLGKLGKISPVMIRRNPGSKKGGDYIFIYIQTHHYMNNYNFYIYTLILMLVSSY